MQSLQSKATIRYHYTAIRIGQITNIKQNKTALAGVAQWIECWPANQSVAGSIPSLGHMSGLQARSPVGGAREATTH